MCENLNNGLKLVCLLASWLFEGLHSALADFQGELKILSTSWDTQTFPGLERVTHKTSAMVVSPSDVKMTLRINSFFYNQ